jgi:hypothetical protein
MLEALGWTATAVFSASYFFRRQAALRRIQAAAACLWIAYGVAIQARPVVIANVIVAAAALFSQWRNGSGQRDSDPGRPGVSGLA